MDKSQALREHGSNDGNSPFEAIPKTLRSSAFIECGAVLTKKEFFKNSDVDSQYQNEQFPNTSQGYTFTGLSFFTDLVFTAGAATDQINLFAHFIRNSVIFFELEGHESMQVPVSKLIPRDVHNNGAGASTVSGLAIRDKVSNVYTLPTPIKYGAGKKLKVWIEPATDLTAAAYAANVTPYHPKSKLGNSERGFMIQLEIDAINYKAS